MKPEYSNWIKEHVDGPYEALGNCQFFVELMVRDFPELKIQLGHVHAGTKPEPGDFQGPWPHWWTIDETGDIIDPTRAQFILIEPITYERLTDDHPARKYRPQKCPNCGRYFHQAEIATCCSEKCDIEYSVYIMGE